METSSQKPVPMYLIRIEHPVPNYERWKGAFDSDPIGREHAGVCGHRIGRSVESPNRVTVDLEFEDLDEARAMLEKLHVMWNKVEGTVMSHVQAQIVEVVEERRI